MLLCRFLPKTHTHKTGQEPSWWTRRDARAVLPSCTLSGFNHTESVCFPRSGDEGHTRTCTVCLGSDNWEPLVQLAGRDNCRPTSRGVLAFPRTPPLGVVFLCLSPLNWRRPRFSRTVHFQPKVIICDNLGSKNRAGREGDNFQGRWKALNKWTSGARGNDFN